MAINQLASAKQRLKSWRLPTTWSRNARGDDYLELLLVAAVSTIIVVRVGLSLTGYPQLGSDGLHIAHVLWGGLLMLAAMIVMMSFINSQALHYAAVTGGVGFGLFIDEIGKYLTQDNDYFYRPAFSLIYLVLVGIFLISRQIGNDAKLTPRERRLNRLVNDGSAEHSQTYMRLEAAYSRFLGTIWANRLSELLIALQAAALIINIIVIMVTADGHYGWLFWISAFLSSLAAVIIVSGAIIVGRDKIQGLQTVQAGTLITIFLVQVFSFYQQQLWAVVTLAISVLVYSLIRYDRSHIQV